MKVPVGQLLDNENMVYKKANIEKHQRRRRRILSCYKSFVLWLLYFIICRSTTAPNHKPYWTRILILCTSSCILSVASFQSLQQSFIHASYKRSKYVDFVFPVLVRKRRHQHNGGERPQQQLRRMYNNLLVLATTKTTSQFRQTSKKDPLSSSEVLLNYNSSATLIRKIHDTKNNTTTMASQPPSTTSKSDKLRRSTNYSVSNQHEHSNVMSINSNTDFRFKLRSTQQQLAAAKNENLPLPPMSQSYLDYLFAECVAHDEWDLAIIDVIDLMKEVQLKVQYSTYNACLQACFQAGNAGSAMQILQTMESMSKSNIQPQINDYTLALLAMCRNDQSESGWCQKAVQLLENVKMKTQQDVPITVYDAILTCLIKERQWKMSVKILQNMEDNIKKSINATPPALSTYRTVIECCVAANQGDAAFRILKSYIQKNGRPTQHGSTMPMPTSYVFEMVIAAQSKSTQQWRQAVQLLDNMLELGIPRTILIYNSLLIACSKAREPIVAKSILQRMKRYDHPQIKPNIISYNTAIAACCMNHQHWRDALSIFDQMQREPGVTPDICTYTNVIRACVKGDKLERAKSLIQVVKAKGLPLDSYFYTAAMEASDWSDALKLLHEMEANGISPTEVSYSVAIKACGKSGQWEKALDLLVVMRSKKMKINIYVYNAAIGAIAKAAKQRTKNVESATGNSLSMEVLSLLMKMRSDGIEPDGFSYSSAISCYGSEGQWEEAIRTIQEMRKGGASIQPNKVAYTAAISSCGRSGQVDMAVQLFEQMQEQGHTPDTVAYNALFLALRVANRTDEVMGLWNEMLGKSRSTPMKASPSPYFPSSRRIRPDIITVTEAIGALSSDSDREPKLRHQIDQITSDAVELGILFRRPGISSTNDAHVSVASEPKLSWLNAATSNDKNTYDLSCLSFPVARAACRYVLMKRILPLSSPQTDSYDNGTAGVSSTNSIDIPDVVFITGSGLQHRLIPTGNKVVNSRDSNNSIGIQQPRSMFMREYIQYMLLNDYNLASVISNRTSPSSSTPASTGGASGNAVTVKAEILKEWCSNVSQQR